MHTFIRWVTLAILFTPLVSRAQTQTKGIQFETLTSPPSSFAGKVGIWAKTSDGLVYFHSTLNVNTAFITGTTTLATTAPLGGGGSLSSNLTLTCATCALTTTTIAAGAGLTGGGDLSANRTISMPNTGPGVGTIGGSANYINSITLDAQGRITAAAVGTPASGSVPSTRSIATTSPLGGGGTLSSDLTLTCTTCALTSTSISAGTGLTGGGDLSASRTISMPATGPGAGTIGGGGSYILSITLDAQGRATAATTGTPPGTGVPTTRLVSTTSPLGGGGALSADLTLTCATCALTTTTITAGTGLSGGGDLSANRTISMPATGPGAGTVGGGATYVNSITLDAQGRVTAAVSGTPAGGGTVSADAPLGGDGSSGNHLTCALCMTVAAGSIGDIVYRTSTGSGFTALADVVAGSFLRSGGTSTAPAWSTLVMPNAATTGDLLRASATNTVTSLPDVATGQVLVSGGVGASPAYSATPTVTGLTGATLTASAATSAAITPGHFGNTSTAAAVNAQRYGLSFESTGNGWKTQATAGSQAVAMGWYTKPVQGVTSPTSIMTFYDRINAGTRTDMLGIGRTANGAGLYDPTLNSGITITTGALFLECQGCTSAVWTSNAFYANTSYNSSLGTIFHIWNNAFVAVYESAAQALPTCTAGSGAGSGTPTCTVTGTNAAGFVTLVTGVGPPANTGTPPTIFTFTTNGTTYATRPMCSVTPGNANAANMISTASVTSLFVDPAAATTSTWVAKQASPITGLASTTTYVMTYTCIGIN